MRQSTLLIILFLSAISAVNSFNMVMMARRGKGGLQKNLDGDSETKPGSISSLNKGKGQEITGVTLPAPGKIKGWEFGDKVTVACANVDGRLYAVEGQCPRCAFDLYKGELIANDPAWEELPRVACPTCAVTYSMNTGRYGPPIKRTGLAGFVSGLTKTATQGDKPVDAQAFQITVDDDDRVYCRKKNKSK